MLLPGRHGAVDSYRYGFQGQEKDDQIKGEGNSINYKYRMHDPRVGRFFARDPLSAKYPWLSPYQFGGNSPIAYIELEGLEVFLSKAQRIDYGYGESNTLGNPQADGARQTGIFLYNSGVSLYNGFVDIFNYAGKVDEANIKANQHMFGKAGQEKVKADVELTVNAVQNYVANTTFDEFKQDLGDVFSNVETYENIFGGLLGAKGIDKLSKINILKNLRKNLPKNGTLSNVEARIWYLKNEANISTLVDKTLPIKEQAKQAFNLRNEFRTKARDLMADRKKAADFEITDPNLTWEQV